MGLNHGTNIVKDGLVFLIDAANPRSTIPSASTTKTFNLIDTAISGTFEDNTQWEGPTTASFTFDGIDDYVLISPGSNNLPIGNAARSFLCWVKPKQISNRQQIFGYGTPSSNKVFDFECGTPYSGTAGNISLHIFNNGVYSSTTDSFTVNNWHNVVVTYNGTTTGPDNIKFYINGVDSGYEVNHGSNGQTLNTSAENYKMGRRSTGSDLDFYGSIGLVQVYNRALSSQEVLQNYNALKSRFGL